MERFVILVNGWKPLTIITKRSILDAAAVLDPSVSGVPSASSVVKCLEDFKKMTGFYIFFYPFFSWVCTFISILHKLFLLSYWLMVWWCLQMKGRLLANVSKNENIRGVFALTLRTHFFYKQLNFFGQAFGCWS